MSTAIPLSNTVQLNADETSQGVVLTPALDGARLELKVRISTNKAPEPPLNGMQLSGTLFARDPAGLRRYRGRGTQEP